MANKWMMRSRSGRRIKSGLISLSASLLIAEDGGTAAEEMPLLTPLVYDGEAADLGSGLMALLDVRVGPEAANKGDDVRPFNCTWLL